MYSAQRHLYNFRSSFPGRIERVLKFADSIGTDWNEWPPHVFVPFSLVRRQLEHLHGFQRIAPDEMREIIAREAFVANTLAAWTVHKDIFTFDPQVLDEIYNRPVSDLTWPRSRVYFRGLPSWSTYLELPEFTLGRYIVRGVFVAVQSDFFLDFTDHLLRPYDALQLDWDAGDQLVSCIADLTSTLDAGIDRLMPNAELERELEDMDLYRPPREALASVSLEALDVEDGGAELRRHIHGVVNLLMYLRRTVPPEHQLSMPDALKDRDLADRSNLQEASDVNRWHVGREISAAADPQPG